MCCGHAYRDWGVLGSVYFGRIDQIPVICVCVSGVAIREDQVETAHVWNEDIEAKGFGFQHARRRWESPEVSGVDVANNQLESQRTHFACALLFTACADAVLLSSGPRDASHVILQKKKPANVLAVAARANP